MPVRSSAEDLFPRGHARGQPAVRFKTKEKSPENLEKRERTYETAHRGRLTQGSTVLGIVTRCDERVVQFALPSGTRARADPHETLNIGGEHRLVDAVAAATGDNQLDGFKGTGAPLYKVLRKGQVVRAAVVAGPSNAGTNHVQLSLQPALVNSGLQAAQLLVKGTPVYAAVKSVEDHGYVLDFGSVPTKGFLPFEETGDIGGDATAEDDEDDSNSQATDEDSGSSSDGDSEALNSNTLRPGTPVEVVVSQTIRAPSDAGESLMGDGKKKRKKKKSKRGIVSTVRVSAKSDLVRKAETLMTDGLNFHGLRAGMRVNAKVLSIQESKVMLTVFGLFSVSVDTVHVPHGPDGTPIVSVGSSVSARLLSVDPGQKSVTASLLPDVVRDFRVRIVPDDWAVGTVVNGLVVDRVSPTFCLFLRHVKESDMDSDTAKTFSPESVTGSVPLFVHISRVAEKKLDRLEKKFYKGLSLEQGARIVSISAFDGVVNADLRPSILNRAALDISEVQLGRVYNCKVVSHLSSGAISVAVDGDLHIRGIIPKLHVADTQMSSKTLANHPSLRTGGTVKCITLSVNHARQMTYLSARKSLVGSPDPLIRSYDEAEQMLKAYMGLVEDERQNKKSDAKWESTKPPVFVGTVSKIMDSFIVVAFCDRTSGTVSFKNLCLDGKDETPGKKRKRKDSSSSPAGGRTREEVEALYPLGQTVRVCILKADAKRRKLFLSMDLTGTDIALGAQKAKEAIAPEIAIGTITDAVIRNFDKEKNQFIISVHVNVNSETEPKELKRPKHDSSSSSLKNGEDAPVKTLDCVIPFGHLADSLSVGTKISHEYLKALKSNVEDSASQPLKLHAVMVLRHDGGIPILTRKQSLIAAHREGRLPSTFTEVEALCFGSDRTNGNHSISTSQNGVDEATKAAILQSTVLTGYVKGVLPTGVFVGFLGGLTGFARKSRIADFFVGDLSRALALNTSIAVSMESLDQDTQRFNVSLRPSDVGGKRTSVYAKSLVDDLAFARTTFGKETCEKEFAIGSVVSGKIDACRPYGIVMKLQSALGTKAVGVALNSAPIDSSTPTKLRSLPESMKDHLLSGRDNSLASAAEDESIISALAETAAENTAQAVTPAARTRSARKKVQREEDTTPLTSVRVLDVDPFSGVIDVSQDVRWVDSASKRPSLSGKNVFQGTVLLVKDYYVILAVQKTKAKTVIAHSLLPAVIGDASLKPGVQVRCRALVVDGLKTSRIFVTIDWNEALKTVLKKENHLRSGEKPGKARQNGVGPLSENIVVGAIVHGPITKVLPYQVHVKIGRLAFGRIHITNWARLTSSEARCLPLGPLPAEFSKRFSLPKLGDVARDILVVEMSDSKHKRTGKKPPKILETELAGQGGRDAPYSSKSIPSAGDRVVAFLRKKPSVKSHYTLSITPHLLGFCHRIDGISDSSSPSSVFENDLEWTPYFCHVQSVVKEQDGEKEIFNVKLSASSNGCNPGKFFTAIIQKVLPGFGLRVGLPWNARPAEHKTNLSGFVSICDVDNDFDEAAKKMFNFEVGEFVRVRTVHVVPHSEEGNQQQTASVLLSMRDSDIDAEVKDALITEITPEQVVKSSAVRGFVSKVNKYGAFLWIGRGIRARVQLCDLSDNFVKEPEKAFPVGTVVQGKISDVRDTGTADAVVAVSLRKEERKPKKKALAVAEGEVVDGVVSRVERFGAIVKLTQGNSALLHTSEADQDRQVKDPWKEWSVGQRITSVVIDANDKKRRVGTKRCHFEAAGVDAAKIDTILENNSQRGIVEPNSKRAKLNPVLSEYDSDNDVMEAMKAVEEGAELSDPESDDGGIESSEGESESEDEKDEGKGPVLKIAHAFPVEEEEEVEELGNVDDENDLDVEGVASGKDENGAMEDRGPRKAKTSKEKREKKRAKEAAEREIQEKEETLAANPNTLESAEDFERMILGEPNSSAIWIRYMAFRLSLAQIDKARSIAERALETIDLTKELERVNLWIAYVNLEVNFGGSPGGGDGGTALTKAAAVFRVLDRATKRVTDVLDFYLQVFGSVRESEPEIAEEVMKRAMRQFKHSKEVWIAAGNAKFEKGDAVGGRKTLERALLSLEKRDQVGVIMKFAQMEYRHGSVERGRTVFESLIGNYPRRLDVWSVFLDMETGLCRNAEEGSEEKTEAVESTRLIFERCASLELSSKKMKSVFKKWLSFEKQFGDKSSHKAVLTKAKQYVESKYAAVGTPEE